jgi:hypothetical protein
MLALRVRTHPGLPELNRRLGIRLFNSPRVVQQVYQADRASPSIARRLRYLSSTPRPAVTNGPSAMASQATPPFTERQKGPVRMCPTIKSDVSGNDNHGLVVMQQSARMRSLSDRRTLDCCHPSGELDDSDTSHLGGSARNVPQNHTSILAIVYRTSHCQREPNRYNRLIRCSNPARSRHVRRIIPSETHSSHPLKH